MWRRAVPNIPAGVPRTATHALTNATLPWALEIADRGLAEAVTRNPALARGVNIAEGRVVHPAVAETFRMRCVELSSLGLSKN